MFILTGLIAVFILFVLSAFWSGSETALSSLSRFRIKKLIVLNKSLAAPLGQWMRSPYYLLTLILVGNTVNDMALSFLATLVMVTAMPGVNRALVELISWVVLTFLVLELGEITPKVFSRANPEKVTLAALPILYRFQQLTYPFITPFLGLFKRMFPRADIMPPVGRLALLSMEEVRSLISEADHSGLLGREARQMLERVLRLGEMEVTRLMVPWESVETANLDQPEDKFLDIVVETGRSRVPVYHGSSQHIVGFVHTKDILWAWRSNQGRFSGDLIRPPYFISPDKKVYDLLREFQSGQTHIAFIRDGMGALTGIITLEDILEEIIGEVLDEYDMEEREP